MKIKWIHWRRLPNAAGCAWSLTNLVYGVPAFLDDLTPTEKQGVMKYIVKHREMFDIKEHQKMLITIVWILPEEKRLFNMYLEVLYIDVTSDTNKEKRPLFTITGRTALGTMFTLMRAYLPNQTAWMFRWLFSVVFVNSFPQGTLKRKRPI